MEYGDAPDERRRVEQRLFRTTHLFAVFENGRRIQLPALRPQYRDSGRLQLGFAENQKRRRTV